jgi:hypothetical protein
MDQILWCSVLTILIYLLPSFNSSANFFYLKNCNLFDFTLFNAFFICQFLFFIFSSTSYYNMYTCIIKYNMTPMNTENSTLFGNNLKNPKHTDIKFSIFIIFCFNVLKKKVHNSYVTNLTLLKYAIYTMNCYS